MIVVEEQPLLALENRSDYEPALLAPENRREYKESTLLRKLKVLSEGSKFPFCVFSDIDETYLYRFEPTREDKQNLSEIEINQRQIKYRGDTRKLTEYLNDRSVPIIAATGRDLTSVQKSQQTDDLPLFDVIASAVGTEIYVLQKDERYLLDEKYQRLVQEESNFNREVIYRFCYEVKENLQRQYPELNIDFQPRDRLATPIDGLTLQNTPEPYKISLNFVGDRKQACLVENSFSFYLQREGYPNIKVLVSTDHILGDGKTFYNLDVVPVTKDRAIKYMLEEFRCKGIVAGDSGNDSEMILNSGDVGVIVGGAKKELLDCVSEYHRVRETRHFMILDLDHSRQMSDYSDQRLLYVEPSNLIGPASLMKALRACEFLRALKRKV